MIELTIQEIKEFGEYILLDELTEEVYFLCLEFDKIVPEIGDKLIISNNLLNRFSPLFAQPYAFEIIGENNISEKIKIDDRACLIKDDNKIFMKRVYG